jgi:hypothetical protein
MISTYKHTIAAGADWKLAARGNFLRCMESQGVVLTASLDNRGKFELEAGVHFATKPFNEVVINNPSAQAVTVKVTVSDEGEITDNRLVGRLDLNGAVSVLSTLASSSVYSSVVATVGGVEVATQNTNRYKLVILPQGSVTINGGITTSSAVEWETTEAVTLTGNNVTVEVLELSR